MQTIGLLGGMSWESSAVYYRLINEDVRRRLGALHSAKIILWSAEFQTIADKQAAGEWNELRRILVDGARAAERAGADLLLICSNTMHKLADEVASVVSIPLLHIADIAASAIRRADSRRPLLLATRFTMDEPFYRERLQRAARHRRHAPRRRRRTRRARHHLSRIVPGHHPCGCQAALHRHRRERARSRGADGLILGCTELDLLLSQDDFDLPVFDTTQLHATAAVDFALARRPVIVGAKMQ